MDQNTDLYAILGAEKGASEAELKKAYRKASLKYHPDRIPQDATEAQKKEWMTESNTNYKENNINRKPQRPMPSFQIRKRDRNTTSSAWQASTETEVSTRSKCSVMVVAVSLSISEARTLTSVKCSVSEVADEVDSRENASFQGRTYKFASR